MSTGDRSSGVAAAGQELADQSGRLSQQAGEQAKAVAGTAVEQARQVGGEAAARAGDLLGETRRQARRQAETQTQRLAESLGRLRDQSRALAGGRPEEAGSLPDMAEQLVSRLDGVVDRIGSGGFDGIVADAQRVARRRPGTFLLGAAALGLAVGRLVRAGAAQHATGQDGNSGPEGGSNQPAGSGDMGMSEPMAVPAAPTPVAPVPPSEVPNP